MTGGSKYPEVLLYGQGVWNVPDDSSNINILLTDELNGYIFTCSETTENQFLDLILKT